MRCRSSFFVTFSLDFVEVNLNLTVAGSHVVAGSRIPLSDRHAISRHTVTVHTVFHVNAPTEGKVVAESNHETIASRGQITAVLETDLVRFPLKTSHNTFRRFPRPASFPVSQTIGRSL